MPFKDKSQSKSPLSAIYACSRLYRRNRNDWPLSMKSYRMMPHYSLAFREIATSSQPPVHRVGRASRRGFQSVQSSIAAHVQKAGLYLLRYLGLYRLRRQMNCISECQCKSLHSLILQTGDVRYPPCASPSLTLRVSECRTANAAAGIRRVDPLFAADTGCAGCWLPRTYRAGGHAP